jgi:hypothetical protein
MRPEAAEADRRLGVREAAQGWQRAGAIDEATRKAIEAAYPDDRGRLGPVFRVLVFGFTVMAVNSLLGLFFLVMAAGLDKAGWFLLLVFGLFLVAATEYQIGPLKRSQGGTESATAFLGVCYLTGGLAWLILEGSHGSSAPIELLLILLALVLGAAAYRWGDWIFAAAAAVVLFNLMARTGFGRVLWVAVPLGLAPVLLRAGDSVRLAPAHRRCSQAIAVVSLVCLYLSVHLASWDSGLIEDLAGSRHLAEPHEASPLRSLFAVATALVPIAILGWGIAARGRLLINLSLVGLLASIVTLRFYVHVAPLWAALLIGGGAALGLALAVRRALDSGAGHERHGFTAEPLFADPERRSALEVAAGVVSLSPAARPVDHPVQPGFQGGGGRSGGGGATGEF